MLSSLISSAMLSKLHFECLAELLEQWFYLQIFLHKILRHWYEVFWLFSNSQSARLPKLPSTWSEEQFEAEEVFWNKYFSFSFPENEWAECSGLLAKSFQRVVETAFYLSAGTFWGKKVFSFKNMRFYRFQTMWKISGFSCRNRKICILSEVFRADFCFVRKKTVY